MPFARASIGILKRMYFRAMFIELGAGLSASYYLLDTIESFGGDLQLGILSYGGEGLAAVGMQLSPRLLLRAQGGFHFGIAAPTISIDGEDQEMSDSAELEQESCPWLSPRAMLRIRETARSVERSACSRHRGAIGCSTVMCSCYVVLGVVVVGLEFSLGMFLPRYDPGVPVRSAHARVLLASRNFLWFVAHVARDREASCR